MKDIYEIAVVGGGYTGLSVATELIDKGYSVILIEKTDEFGGLGKTIDLSNGFKCEAFYHHFFTQDVELLRYTKRFLNKYPSFNQTKMGIFYKGKNYSWNGIIDLLKYPHINLLGKFRFLLATLLLTRKLVKNEFLDSKSLSDGLLKLYGIKSFQSVWDPMIKGKFGNMVNYIPLRWMEGRLKQRIESRKSGKEKLGYLRGSLKILTEKIVKYIRSKNSKALSNSSITNIYWDKKLKRYKLEINTKKVLENIYTDKIVFTTSSSVANYLIKDIELEDKNWKNHRYFTAYCIVLELYESLSEYYWTNIADTNLFFCGYIEQTKLTKNEEYGGLHIAYLTKYIFLEENEKILSQDELKKKAFLALRVLFPNKDIEKIVKNMHFSISKNAQVITDFKFKESKMDLLKSKNLFIGNMSNVYPDERSINNAIKVGIKLASNID